MDFSIEIVHLKEELFKELREFESKFLNMFAKKSSEIEGKNKSSLEKIDAMMRKSEQMFISINNQQMKLEKIVELESFKNKINDMIISHEYRIKNISKDLENMKFKYDREIIQNLSVPGYVGPSCPFKTISEYLLSNINEINKLKNEKDLTKKENKDLKSKIDSIMKNVFNLVDNSVTRCNGYTDNKQKYFENLLNTKLTEFNEKNMEMKTQVLTNQRIVDDQLNKLMKLSDELMKIKDDVGLIVDKKYDEMNLVVKELTNKIDKINNEIKKNNKNYENLNNSIKKSGLLQGNNFNNNNFKSVNNFANNMFQKRQSLINIKTSPNNITNSLNLEEKHKKEKESIGIHKKPNEIFQQKKLEKYESTKNNKSIDKSSKEINKERKSLNIKDYNSINIQINSEDKKIKTKPLYNLKNNINSYETQYKSILKNKREINDVNYLGDKTSTERKIKNNLNKNNINRNINNIKMTLSDDELDSNKNKNKLSKYFEKISLNKNNINNKNIINNISKSKLSKYYEIINSNKNSINNLSNNKNNKSNYIGEKSNSNLRSKNKNEIYDLKTSNYMKKRQINTLNSKNNLLTEKYTEKSHIRDLEETKNMNYKIKKIDTATGVKGKIPSRTTIIEFQKEPILIAQKINNILYPNEQIINKINTKKDLFQQFLEKHNLKLNNSLDYITKKKISKKYDTNIISNKMFGTRSINNYYDYYNETLSNNINKMSHENLLLKEINQYNLNKRYNYSQENSRKNFIKKNNLIIENHKNKNNNRLITLDNNFKSPMKKHIFKSRNNEELVLPITNTFKTFQVNKNIVNNVTEEFPAHKIPIFSRTGFSYYSKKQDKKRNLNNFNKYKKNENQSIFNFHLDIASVKTAKLYK